MMKYALLLALVSLLGACSEPASTPFGELSKEAAVEAGTPVLVFVYTDG